MTSRAKRSIIRRVLVWLSVIQSAMLLVWTQVSNLPLSTFLLGLWGLGFMCLVTTYINYVQVNVASTYRTRAFSIYDQSISFNVIVGSAVVAVVGDHVSPYVLLSSTALLAFIYLTVRAWSSTIQALYTMET